MVSFLTHHCQRCAYDTEVPSSVLFQNQHCLRVRGRTALLYSYISDLEQCGPPLPETPPQAQQTNMHEDLVALFSRNLTFSNQPQVVPATPAEKTQPQPAANPQPASKPNYSISQHYHHSAHLAASAPPSTAPSPAIPEQDTDVATAEIILSRCGVDPTTLLPSQLLLFQKADVSQKMRLAELWRISPPNASAHELGIWSRTNLQQGEGVAMADVKNNREEQEKLDILMHEQQLDQPNKAWAEQDQSSNQNLGVARVTSGNSEGISYGHRHGDAEPYILSGYETLAKRDYDEQAQMDTEAHIVKQRYSPLGSAVGGEWTPEMQLQQESQQYNRATDPVYSGLDYWSLYHAKPLPSLCPEIRDDSCLVEAQLKSVMAQQCMEHQYGALEELNRLRSPISLTVGAHYQDEDMM
ncbi:hypothetical protein GP486_006654 [Trichoglossum hirsutum]|uniref:Uncharacterized protein n=1 Tax=Trichoglossum hirsutum TaxID=265104 RepID=A0A9P8IDB4_9PEZI|nr:hypothetical protein GP486_006654 [Trichoglossum hirsutum]